jgi:hypothetical protein
MKFSLAMVIGVAAVVALPQMGQAQQSRARTQGNDIPVSARPPAGMCRVWLDDVPVAQQPAPTDCPTAVRNRSPKSRVIFGDDYVTKRDTTKKTPEKPSPIKGFAPSKGTTRKPFSLRVP